MTTDQLRIESPQGQTLVEYRIHHGHIEVRAPGASGAAESGAAWRRLSAREFSTHLAQNPALAQWLRARAQGPRRGPTQEEPSAA